MKKKKKPVRAKGSPANSVVGGSILWLALGGFIQWLRCPYMDFWTILYRLPETMFLRFLDC